MPTPNFIKYSTTPDDKSIKIGNYSIGVASGTTYGPTSGTSYWSGISPPTSGYTIYENKVSNGPSIRVASSSAGLIDYANRLYSGSSITTEAGALTYFNSLTDVICVNRDYEEIVTSGLTVNLDAGFTPSYPLSGTSWTDLSFSGNNGTLVNGPTFNSSDGGSIVFDGVDDYISTPIQELNRPCTLSVWVNLNSLTGFQTFAGQNTSTAIVRGRFYFQKAGETTEGLILNTVNFSIVLSGGGIVPVNSNNVIVTNIWYNYTAVLTTTTISLYENGTLQNTVNDSNTFLTPNTTITLNAGYYNNSIVDYINGKSSSFLIYNRALSAAEVLQNFNALRGRYGI
jgi:hypothetical protein